MIFDDRRAPSPMKHQTRFDEFSSFSCQATPAAMPQVPASSEEVRKFRSRSNTNIDCPLRISVSRWDRDPPASR
jgi:hypothetical protein